MTKPEAVLKLLRYLNYKDIRSEYNSEAREACALLEKRRENIPSIHIGSASCGRSAGASGVFDAVREFLEEKQIQAGLFRTGCLGFCSEEPLLDIRMPGKNRVFFRQVHAEDVPLLLDRFFSGKEIPEKHIFAQMREPGTEFLKEVPFFEDLPFFRKQKRIVLRNCGIIDPESFGEYLARGGYRAFALALHTMTPAEICRKITEAGLRGRGGAGFPTGKKWTAALNSAADGKTVVCNADEGDPGAFATRTLLESDPHSVLEGLAIAAYACGARRGIVYMRKEYIHAEEMLKNAICQAKKYGLLGENILDSGVDLQITLKTGAGAFICGEETALIACLEGRRGVPKPRPPYPTGVGLFGKPTVVNNAETLANVPCIVRSDGTFPAGHGTYSTGTKIFTVSGNVKRAGLVETPFGTTLGEIVREICGGESGKAEIKAVQTGGPSGGCLPKKLFNIPLDYETLSESGAMIGSGGIVVLDETNCMVDMAKFFMEFMRRESCGKCAPCREGTRQLCAILEKIVRGECSGKNENGEPLEIELLKRISSVLRDTSLCGLGRTAPNPILTTLEYFREEYENHLLSRTRCPVCGAAEGTKYV